METVRIPVISTKHLTTRERRERFWIAKLERLPCFEQIVKRLTDGHSVVSVVRWARSLKTDCELKTAGFETWRKYVNALSLRIRATLEARPEMRPKSSQAIIEDVKAQADAYDVPLTENGRRLWRQIAKATKELNAEMMLKCLFVIQMDRVEKMLELETKMGLLLPEGYKDLAVLAKIAAEVRKYEVGELCINCQEHMEPSGHNRRGPLPNDPTRETSSMDSRFTKLEKVDKSLLRAAGARIMNMIR